MRRKIGYLLAVSCAVLMIGCNSENREVDTMVTVEEIPISDVETVVENTTTQMVSEENTTEEVAAEEVATEEVATEEATTAEVVVNGNEGTIRIGTIGTPYTEILTQAKLILAKEGWDLQVEVYDDYEKMNQDVIDGNLDAHLFAHQTYLDSYNDVHGAELVAAAEICYEKYGVYSMFNQDLTKIQNGVTVGIPQDATKRARALLFLQDMRYLTLEENVGLTAVLEDITDNPKNIHFVEYTSETITNVLETAEYCIMGADQAILAGLEPKKDALKEETPVSESAKEMVALLVTTKERYADEKLTLLEDAIKSDETKKYMTDIYKGAWGLFP